MKDKLVLSSKSIFLVETKENFDVFFFQLLLSILFINLLL